MGKFRSEACVCVGRKSVAEELCMLNATVTDKISMGSTQRDSPASTQKVAGAFSMVEAAAHKREKIYTLPSLFDISHAC